MSRDEWDEFVVIRPDGGLEHRRVPRSKLAMRCVFPGCEVIECPPPVGRNVCREHERQIGEALKVRKMLADWPRGETH